MDNARNVPDQLKKVIDIDQQLRKMIAEYYMELMKLNDHARSVEMLADHVAIMVEMINEFKR